MTLLSHNITKCFTYFEIYYIHQNFINLVDGEWGSWNNSLCSTSCGGGDKTKVRLCNNPSPSLRGRNCLLSDDTGTMDAKEELTLKCNEEECPSMYFRWGVVRCGLASKPILPASLLCKTSKREFFLSLS